MRYLVTRSFATAARQYQTGDELNVSTTTTAEFIRGTESGAIQPVRFYGTAAEVAAMTSIPGPGVSVYEHDTGVHRIGDGVTPAASLDQVGTGTYARPVGRRAVLIGDSWIDTCIANSGTPNTYGGIRYYNQRSWWMWAGALLKQRIDPVNFAGVTGQTSAQVLARFDTDVTPYAPHIVFGADAGVINDVIGSVPTATSVANVTAFMDKCQAIGALCVLFTVPPKSSSAYTTAQLALSFDYSVWLKAQAQQRRGLVVVDVHAILTDGTTADNWLDYTHATYTADGTHLGPSGAARVGKAVANALSPLVPALDILPMGSADSPSLTTALRPNLITNAAMLGTTGTKNNGATGSLADSWTLNSTSGSAFTGAVACSKVARTDWLPGEWQQINVANTADGIILQQVSSAVGTLWNPGDTIETVCEFQQDADWSSVLGIRLHLYARDASNNQAAVYGCDLSGGDAWPTSENPMTDVVLRTPPLIIPSAATQLYTLVRFRGAGTIRVGRIATRKVA